MSDITVKLVRSRYGCTPKQRATLEAMGLWKIRQEKTFKKSPSVEGMIERVKHMVEVTS